MRVCLFAAVLLLAMPVHGTSTFTGAITDSECATANHSLMKMGDTDPDCVKACVDAHGATYLLYDGTTAYQLTDQSAAAAHAGRRVTVTGTLDSSGTRITVQSIAAAK